MSFYVKLFFRIALCYLILMGLFTAIQGFSLVSGTALMDTTLGATTYFITSFINWVVAICYFGLYRKVKNNLENCD